MPSSEEAMEALSRALEDIAHEIPLVCAYLYGSRARGEASTRSDYDIGLYLADGGDETPGAGSGAGEGKLELNISRLLEAKTGLSQVDVRILNRAPLMVRGKVLTEGKLLFVADDEARVRIERDTRIPYLEFRALRLRMDQELLFHISKEGLRRG